MAIDSSFSGDGRGSTGGGEKVSAAGLKLVTDRVAPSDAMGATGPREAPIEDGASARGSGGPASGSPPAASLRARGSGRRLPLWIFVLLILVFLFVYGFQSYHASELEGQVARLEASLADAEGRLESHRTHLLEIRSGIHDLSGRLEALQALIDRDPVAGAAEPPAAVPDGAAKP